MRCSCVLRRACFSNAVALRRRFIPPWERSGETAEAFFAGLQQSLNPIQRERRERRRAEAAEEAARAESQPIPEEVARLLEIDALHEKAMAEKRDFLPYGATPRKYFRTDQMAAWGEYQTSLGYPPGEGAGPGYSAETNRLLAADMASKIPYRYSAYVPPPADGAGRWPLHGTAGVVLDVDGVVCRGDRVVPGAPDAIRALQTLRIPFIFLTNGGACGEAAKARALSELIGCAIAPEQVVLAHSPMRLLAPRFRREVVVVVGPPGCAAVARGYGFARAVSVLAFQAAHPETVPFKRWAGLGVGRAAPGALAFPRVTAVLQFADAADAFNDAQTTIDLLLAPHGRVGGAVCGAQAIPYFQAADDLLWAAEAPLPRLGTGAYREMLAAVFASLTGRRLQVTFFGKPRGIAFAYAAARLRARAAALGWRPDHLRAIFMVGDNLDSDVLGANAAGGLWTSVHVLSGVGRAPAAARARSDGDDEFDWLATSPSAVPHYVAPTVDHFVRELLAFPESAMLQNKRPYYGKMNPVDLKETYNFDPAAD